MYVTFRLSTAKTIGTYVAFFGPRRCGSLIWLSINGCCITCILNHDRCFFTVGIKAIGWDVIQVHRRKIYKCARCLRFNAHHVIGYHTSKRISFFINFWLKFSKDMIFVKQVLIPRTCQCLCFFNYWVFYTVFVRRVWF